jgi:hypothetical protein
MLWRSLFDALLFREESGMPANEGEAFAERWIAAWNSLDLDRVLALWSDDLRFSSPYAAEVVGSAELRGKVAVAHYWREALGRIGALCFDLERTLWDPQQRIVTIIYRSRRGDTVKLATEIVRLDADGIATEGSAFYGAELESPADISLSRRP